MKKHDQYKHFFSKSVLILNKAANSSIFLPSCTSMHFNHILSQLLLVLIYFPPCAAQMITSQYMFKKCLGGLTDTLSTQPNFIPMEENFGSFSGQILASKLTVIYLGCPVLLGCLNLRSVWTQNCREPVNPVCQTPACVSVTSQLSLFFSLYIFIHTRFILNVFGNHRKD